MTVAFLFAGQGVDPPWIDADLVARASSRELLDAASTATKVDITTLLVRGGRELASVEILQPAFITACLIAAAALAEIGVTPAVTCGHSLGELAAWSAGGHIAATDAIKVAAVRGRLMAREAALHPGGMAAVRTVDLDEVLALGRAHGTLVLAADNTPDEQVVSGDEAALAAIVRCSTRLPVAGAWHSEAMTRAVDELTAALKAVPRRASDTAFISNRRGCLVPKPNQIPSLIADQLVHPVRWQTTLRALAQFGVTRYVIVGPGRAMRMFLRATLGDVDARIVTGEKDLA